MHVCLEKAHEANIWPSPFSVCQVHKEPSEGSRWTEDWWTWVPEVGAELEMDLYCPELRGSLRVGLLPKTA